MKRFKADASPCGENELYGLIYAMRNCFCEPCMYDDPGCELGRKCGPTPGDTDANAARAPLVRPRGEPDKTREEVRA